MSVDLVTDHPRARAVGTAAGSVAVALPAGMQEAELLAAFAVLLHRYSGQGELAIGVPAGTAVLRVGPGVAFPELVRAAGRVRLPGRRPPRQGCDVRFITAGAEPVADLALRTQPAGLLFDEGLFDRAMVERMAGLLTRIARQVQIRPWLRVGEIDLVTGEEQELILGGFNATARPYPRDATVHGLFAEQAAREPDRVAVTSGRRRLTYRELDVASDRFAGRLRAAGLRLGGIAGLLAPRGPELVVATLAVLKAGGTCLPIDPDYPDSRVALLLADSSARLVVAAPGVPAPAGFTGAVLRIDLDSGPAQPVGTAQPAGSAEPLSTAQPVGPAEPLRTAQPAGPVQVVSTDSAYVIYTSGTTGRPKGVQVSHRGVVRLVREPGYLALTPRTRLLATCSPVFDVATFEVWGPLLNGGSLHLVPADVILSAAALGRVLVEQAITTMWLTAPLFNQLVEQDAAMFRPLRELLVGGDALSARHVGKALAACPELTVVNGYGPTENTTFSTTHVVTTSDLERIPIGRPIANSTAYVLDRDGRLCPVGVPGELCLGGDGVAGGYLDRPALTAAAFVPDPFEPGRRMYRSGDVARWRPDGVLEFFGRRDHQVKVRGHRIELGEVEHAMLAHPAVRQAVAVAHAAPAGADRRLCGYYVADPAVTPAQLRAELAGRLPEHMVPVHLVPLAGLPLNQSGKVDRERLPAPAPTPIGDGAPRDATESALLGIVARALAVPGTAEPGLAETGLAETGLAEPGLAEPGLAVPGLAVPGLGVRDDLRDLGADSLVATLVAGGIAAELGVQLPVSRILRAGTVEEIARLVRDRAGAVPPPGVAPVLPLVAPVVPSAPELADYPVTPQQHRLYVEQCKDATAVHYNVPVTVDLPAGTDPERLVEALGRLAARHDALRTEFVFDSGELRQRIRPTAAAPVDLVASPPAVERFVRPFDLGRGPLWRAVVHPDAQRVRLQIDLHHTITDGVSLAVLFEELDALYHGTPLPPAGPRYRDYAHWSGGAEQPAARQRLGAHWAQVFADPPPATDLPLDRPRPPIRSLPGAAVEFDLGATRTAGLRRLARRLDMTLFAVLAAAHSALTARLTGEADVVIGTPVSGRTTPGFERTVGMFVNTVCLRTVADPDLTFAEYARRLASTADDAFAHQDFPLQDLVARVAPGRDYRRTPLFDSLIALHSSRYLRTRFGGREVPIRLEFNGQAVFDLNLQLYEAAGSLLASWQYASRLLDHDTVAGWRDALVDLIDTTLADPDTPVGELTGATRARLPDLEFDL